jgi:hypothetical protein
MFRSLVAKVMWVGRATVFMVGLSVMLALLFGIATTALAGNGPGGIFNLGQKNTVNRLTQLVGAPTSGAMLRVDNDGSGTALELKVGLPTANPADKTPPPMTVDSQAKVTNLNADELDGFDSSELQRGLSSECAVGSSIDANGVVSCEPDNDSGAAEVNRLRTELATTDEGGPNEGRDPVSYTKLKDVPAGVANRDADTLDGKSSADFATAGHKHATVVRRGTATASGKTVTEIYKMCQPGEFATGGGGALTDPTSRTTMLHMDPNGQYPPVPDDSWANGQVMYEFPMRYMPFTTTPTFAGDGQTPEGWGFGVSNESEVSRNVEVWVICQS